MRLREVLDLPFRRSQSCRAMREDPSEEDPIEEDDDMSLDGGAGVDGAAAPSWRAALGELSGTLSAAAFETWFRGSTGVAWVGDVFTVGAPHRFAQEWIDVRFRQQAEEALARVAGRRLQLVVEVTGPGASPRPSGRGRDGRAARQRQRLGALGQVDLTGDPA